MDLRAKTLAQGSSAFEESPDSQAVTVRTPNTPPLERPVVLTRDGRVIDPPVPAPAPAPDARSPSSTLEMSVRPVPSRLPLSLRAPASRQSEAQWFEKEPLVAPGVAEMPESVSPPHAGPPASATLAPARRARGGGFVMVAVLLVGIATAGSVFFLTSSKANEARAPEPASTTQVTNADVPAAPVAPTPAAAPAKPDVKTVRAVDLPSSAAPSAPAPARRAVETTSPDAPESHENR